MKQVVLINHSWISPTKRVETGVLFNLQKMGEGTFFCKKGEVGKIVEEWSLLRQNNLCLPANLFVYISKKHYIPRYIYIHIKVTSFIIYQNFLDKAFSKIQIYICMYVYIYAYVCIYIHIYIYICIYIYMYIYIIYLPVSLLVTDHIFGKKRYL